MHLTRRDSLRLLGLGSLGSGLSFDQAAAGPAEGRGVIPQSRLEAVARYCTEQKSYALFVKQHGKVIHESYINGATRGEVRRIYSGTKGFWGLAAMCAVEDDLIRLDEPVAATIHEWQGDERKAKVTVEQLLDFTGGLERCVELHQDGLTNRNARAIARPLVASPGKAFIYGPSQLQVFHELLKRRLAARKRKDSPTRFLEKRVLGPMGLGTQRYLPDKSGNPLLAAGFLMTPAQWAHMGEVLLNGGAPVLKKPESFKAMMEGSAANPAYSFGFWNNRAAVDGGHEADVENMLDRDWESQSWKGLCLCKDAPPDMVACIGSAYQRLFVMPSMGLIVVRQGQGTRFSDARFLRMLLGQA